MYHTLGSKRRFGLSSGLSKPFENPMLSRPNGDRRPDLVLKAIDTNVKTDSSPQKKKSYQKPAASPPSAQEPPRSGPRSALDSLSESSLLLSLPTTKPASLPPLESNNEDTPAVLSLLACPPTANKMAYFMSLTTTATSDEYLRFLLAISNGKVSVLEQMIVETAAWHLDRCDGHMNLLGFIQQFFQCRLFKKLPDIMTPAQLRIQYYNDYTRGKQRLRIAASPPLHLPPTLLPVNIHQIGAVGQCCKFGEENCSSFKNRIQPTFTEVAVSIMSKSVQQKAPICNSCYTVHFSFDPAKTFADKLEFDSAMKTHACNKGFKVTKATGPKTVVGGVNMPKYFSVCCSKKSANRSTDCECGFKVTATLVQKDGGHCYRMTTMQLEHDHKMA